MAYGTVLLSHGSRVQADVGAKLPIRIALVGAAAVPLQTVEDAVYRHLQAKFGKHGQFADGIDGVFDQYHAVSENGVDTSVAKPRSFAPEAVHVDGDSDAIGASALLNLETPHVSFEHRQAGRAEVVTDGLSHPGDFQGLAGRIAASGITVSTVGVGPEVAKPLLEDVARLGRGHFYYCTDPAAIPEIFALETASAGKLGISEQPFSPLVIHGERFLEGIDLGSVPLLWGHVETRPKPSGRVILATKEGEPLLVWWRYGLGVSLVFTSDVESRWAADWLKWPEFGPLWSRLARHAMRKDQARDFLLEASMHRGRAAVLLEAVDREGRFLNDARARLSVIGPGRKTHDVPVEQVAPGRYAARFPAVDQGAYCMELTLDAGGRTVFRRRAGLVVGYADELRLRPADRDLLRSMAIGGGSHDLKASDVFAPSGKTVVCRTAAWPYLLTLALLAFVLDVSLRRVPLLACPAVRGTNSAVTLPDNPAEAPCAGPTGFKRLLLGTTFMAVACAVSAYLLERRPAFDAGPPTAPGAPADKQPVAPESSTGKQPVVPGELGWRVAPPAAVTVGRVEPAVPSLEELADQVRLPGEPATGREPSEVKKASAPAVGPEPIPLDHRRMIHRYFESIRQEE